MAEQIVNFGAGDAKRIGRAVQWVERVGKAEDAAGYGTAWVDGPTPFLVLVQCDGGDDAADNTSAATYTYSLFNVYDDSLTSPIATALTPEKARWNGFMVAADDGTYGLAVRDANGDIILLEAYGEARRTQPCT